MPTNIRSRSTRQINRRPLKVLRRPPLPSRNPRRDALQAFRIRQQGLIHIRLDVPRRNGIDSDAFCRPLVGEALCQLADSALGCRVCRDGEATLEGQERGEVDNAASTACDGGGFEVEHVGADVSADGED